MTEKSTSMDKKQFSNFVKAIEKRVKKEILLEKIIENKDIWDDGEIAQVRTEAIRSGKMSEEEFDAIFRVTYEEIAEMVNSRECSVEALENYLAKGDLTDRQVEALVMHGLGERIFDLSSNLVEKYDISREKAEKLGFSDEEIDRYIPDEGIALPNIDWENIDLVLDANCTNFILLGISGSGKTMLLSALLYEASKYAHIRGLPSVDILTYYEFLSELPDRQKFVNSRTASDVLFSIPVNITKKVKSFFKTKTRLVKINLVELAGEDFSEIREKGDLPSDKFRKLFEDKNSNIINLVIDYEICTSSEEIMYQQKRELIGAFGILKEKGVFEKSDYINVIVTKWDKNTEYATVDDFFADRRHQMIDAINHEIAVVQEKYKGVDCHKMPFSIGTTDNHGVKFKYDSKDAEVVLEFLRQNCASSDL
jgi:hypothetical protein